MSFHREDDPNLYLGEEPRRLLDILQYALTVARRSPDEDLDYVGEDLAEAAFLLIPMAEWLESRETPPVEAVIRHLPLPSTTFRQVA